MGIERVLVAQWSVLLHARSRAAHGECHAAESSHGGDSALNARFGAAGRSAHFERFPPARVRRRAPAGVERLLSDWSRMIRRRGCRTWGRDRREIAGHESIADRARHPFRPGGIALAVSQESAVVSFAGRHCHRSAGREGVHSDSDDGDCELGDVGGGVGDERVRA